MVKYQLHKSSLEKIGYLCDNHIIKGDLSDDELKNHIWGNINVMIINDC